MRLYFILLIIGTAACCFACSTEQYLNSIDYSHDTAPAPYDDSDLITDSDGTVYYYDTDSNIVIMEDTDTEDGPFWEHDDPKQLSLARVELTCDESSLEPWECEGAPTPCVPNEPKITCNIIFIDEDNTPIYDGPAGIERRGRSSLYYDKPNYALELRNADGSNNPVPCMGMGKEEDWILDGSWLDRSFLRNDFIGDIFRELGPGNTHYSADSRFVTFSFNGREQGIYRLVEKIKRDDDRINIPVDSGAGTNFVVKHDDDGDMYVNLFLETNYWNMVYPNDEKITTAQKSAVQNWLALFAIGVKAF